MNYKKLPDICNITTGKLDANAAVAGGAYPFFTCAPEPTTIDSFAFDCDAILLAGNNAQGNFHITRYNGKFNAYQRTYVITAKDGYNIDFIKYMLELSLTHFKSQAQGSQTKFLTIQILNSFSIPDIPLEEQIKTVSPLVALDKKINNNNIACAELETMTKTLYDYWFVQFDFPDENGKPYRTSGGEMEWCPRLKKEIPKGWKTGNLYDIADYINGLACQNYRPAEGDSSLPVIKIREMHEGISADTESVSANIPTKYIIEDGDILFSWSATLEVMYWTGGKGGLNQHIFKVIPKEDYPKEYVYLQLSTYIINFVKMAEARKTTMGHITSDHMQQSRIVLPPTPVLRQFHASIAATHDRIIRCKKENRELSQLRDWLLPMLMNGQALLELKGVK